MNKMILEAQRGDTAALKHIIDIFTPFIFKEALRFKIKGYEYEDIIQHGFLSVIKAIKMFKGQEIQFKAYVKKSITNNYCALLKREIRHFREVQGREEDFTDRIELDFDLEEEFIAYEKMKPIYEAIDRLDKNDREILNKFYVHGKKMQQIAREINLSYNEVRYKKSKAINNLRRKLKKQA